MTIVKARLALIAIFVLGLVLQVIVAVVAYSLETIAQNDLISLLTKLLAVYSVHFAVIIGGIVGQRQSAKQAQVSATAFWLAIALAVVWNGLLLWRSVMFGVAAYDPSREDRVGYLLFYLDVISSAGSWLVAGFLAFFFTKR